MTLHTLHKKLPNKRLLIVLERGEVKITYFVPGVVDLEIETCYDETVSISVRTGRHHYKETKPCAKDRKEEMACELAYSYILEEEEK